MSARSKNARWEEINQAIRVETANVLQQCGHLYWAYRLRMLPVVVDLRSAGEAEDLLAEINTALGLGLTEFERRAV